MQAKFIGKSEDKYQNLLKELEPSIQAEYTKRCEEAVKEGDDLIPLGFLGRCDEVGKASLKGLKMHGLIFFQMVLAGGSKSVHVLGSWTIPSLITDEEAFRKQIM